MTYFEEKNSETGVREKHRQAALRGTAKKLNLSNAEIVPSALEFSKNKVFTSPVTFQVLMENLPDAYIVGGAVRDEVMGLEPHDIDIVTSATPDEVLKMFKRSYDVGGQKYGTVLVMLSDELKEVEVTTMRREISGGRHPKVVFTKSILEDLFRRDFTMNAMAMDIEGNIIDPYGGREDIKNLTIRTVYDPYETLDINTGDPLRAIRAVRFAHKLKYFSIEPTLEDAIRKADLSKISGERIYMELEKMFEKDASRALVYLKHYGILEKILPEINVMDCCQHNIEHHPEGNCFEHTLCAMEFVNDESMLVKMAVLLHDIGKPVVWVEGSTTYYAHEKAGVAPGRAVMKRLGRPKVEQDAIAFVIKNHMKVHKLHEMKPSKRRALYDSPHFDLLLKVCAADGSMRGHDPCEIERFVELDVTTRTSPVKPLLDGHTIMEYGISPGPLIKKIQDDLIEQQIEGNLSTEKDALEYFMRKYVITT
ncbi:CCA tRNA nucleotidyltransferase [Candidatus Dependentiae bacterium]|nr:CCA tRNA nucleotidyltransferase [Candidatus Dependentiae bacterium]